MDKNYFKSIFVGVTFFVALFAAFLPLGARAADYYVNSAIGSDDNPGTESAPFKTIQKAVGAYGEKPSGTWVGRMLGKAVCGDTVYVASGNYTNDDYKTKPAVLNKACTSGNRLVIRAMGSGVITNGFIISA